MWNRPRRTVKTARVQPHLRENFLSKFSGPDRGRSRRWLGTARPSSRLAGLWRPASWRERQTRGAAKPGEAARAAALTVCRR
jgi:hypothetical protein